MFKLVKDNWTFKLGHKCGNKHTQLVAATWDSSGSQKLTTLPGFLSNNVRLEHNSYSRPTLFHVSDYFSSGTPAIANLFYLVSICLSQSSKWLLAPLSGMGFLCSLFEGFSSFSSYWRFHVIYLKQHQISSAHLTSSAACVIESHKGLVLTSTDNINQRLIVFDDFFYTWMDAIWG